MPFSEFIDKTANKLQCLAVFNGLFIYSLTLEKNIASKSLIVSFLFLSLILMNTVVRDAIKSYNVNSLAYFPFIACLVVGMVALSLYAAVKYPEFLHSVIFVLILVIIAIGIFASSAYLDTTKFGSKLKVFRTDTPFNDAFTIISSLIVAYILEGLVFNFVTSYIKMMPLG